MSGSCIIHLTETLITKLLMGENNARFIYPRLWLTREDSGLKTCEFPVKLIKKSVENKLIILFSNMSTPDRTSNEVFPMEQLLDIASAISALLTCISGKLAVGY